MVDTQAQAKPNSAAKPDEKAWQAINAKSLPFNSRNRRKLATEHATPSITQKRDSIAEDSVFRTKESIMQETQRSIVEVKRGSFTLDPAKRNGKMNYMTHFDSTV